VEVSKHFHSLGRLSWVERGKRSLAFRVHGLDTEEKKNASAPDKNIDVVLLNEDQTDKSKFVFCK
jgi:hypothetical protein